MAARTSASAIVCSADESAGPTLSVIVPAYNEGATIARLLDRVLCEPTDKEILIVDDGSTDGTLDVARRWVQSASKSGLPDHIR